jgi:hypothetical protein
MGLAVIGANEEGRRNIAGQQTLFFLPHCEVHTRAWDGGGGYIHSLVLLVQSELCSGVIPRAELVAQPPCKRHQSHDSATLYGSTNHRPIGVLQQCCWVDPTGWWLGDPYRGGGEGDPHRVVAG